MSSHSEDTRLQQAIEALNTETCTLNRQTRALTIQTAAITQRRSRGRTPDPNIFSSKTTTNARAKQITSTQISNDALTASIITEIHEHNAGLTKEARGASGHVTTRLKADDRALAAILDRAGRLNDDDGSGYTEAELVKLEARIQKLTSILCVKRVEALKNHLDTVYLSSIPSTQSFPEGEVNINRGHDHSNETNRTTSMDPASQEGLSAVRDSQEAVSQLRSDISTLYTEIEDMTTMLINTEHTVSLQDTISQIRARRQEAEQMVLRHALDSLRQMTANTTAMSQQAQAVSAERRALQEIEAQLGRVQREAQIKSAPRSAQITTTQKAAVKTASSAPRAGRVESYDHASGTNELVEKVKEVDILLKTALETRFRAIATLPSTVEYTDEMAAIGAVEHRIGDIKEALEATTRTVTPPEG
jgi:hypothetical protein